MRVLGIDPGLANCGWAVVEGDKIIDTGVLVTRSKTPHDERIAYIYDELMRIGLTEQVTHIVNERLPYGAKMQGASGICEVIGVIALASVRLGVPRIECSPMTAKKAATGSGKATKDDVMKYVRSRDNRWGLCEHNADAAMMAYVFIGTSHAGNA